MFRSLVSIALVFMSFTMLSAQKAHVDTIALNWEFVSEVTPNGPLQYFNGSIWQRLVDYSWLRSDDEGETWETVSLPDTLERIVLMRGGADHWIIKVVGNGTGFYYSGDEGQTWRRIVEGIDGDDFWIDGNRIFFFGKELVWSADQGMTWNREATPPERISQMFRLENTLFFIAQFSHNYYRSTDEGQSWERFDGPLSSPNALGFFDNQLWCTAKTGQVWLSDDLGQSWVPSSDSLPDSGWGWPLFRDRFDCAFIENGLIVMEDHYFLLSNNFPYGIARIIFGQEAGGCWAMIENMPTLDLKSYFFSDNYFLIQDAENLWRVNRLALEQSFCITTSLATPELQVETFKVYPNPVLSDQLVLEVYSVHDSFAEVIISDGSGQVKEQYSRILRAGNNRLPFKLAHLPAGTYTMVVSPKGRSAQVIKFVK